MGRHRAEPEVRRRSQRAANRAAAKRSPELLGWGVFLSGTTALCLLWAQVPASVTAGATGLLLAAFAAAWYASRSAPPQAAPPDPAPAERAASAPVRSEPHPEQTPAKRPEVPSIPLAPGAVQEFLTAAGPGPEAPAGSSRWTRAFGPPDTGSLPLQPYVPALRASVHTADPERQDRRQRSHSSL